MSLLRRRWKIEKSTIIQKQFKKLNKNEKKEYVI